MDTMEQVWSCLLQNLTRRLFCGLQGRAAAALFSLSTSKLLVQQSSNAVMQQSVKDGHAIGTVYWKTAGVMLEYMIYLAYCPFFTVQDNR